ncbi:hypothetical protein BDB01DRAFT_810712 [Pilobolus umbonatus]|nr:hypothetical protein BDB01DRAFT_810712 [Pilobolus umbonatus]
MTTLHPTAYNGCQSEADAYAKSMPSYPSEAWITSYKLMNLLPDVPALKGTAWHIPVESASQDMIMLAQYFHWFDDIQSLREFYRVLKPGGIIRCEWVRRLRDYYEVYDGTAPQYRKGTWKHVFNTEETEALFHPLQHRRFPFDTPAN